MKLQMTLKSKSQRRGIIQIFPVVVLVQSSDEGVGVPVRPFEGISEVMRVLVLRELDVPSERSEARKCDNEENDDLEHAEDVLES